MKFVLAALFVVVLVILQACSEEKGDPLFPEDDVADQMEIELKGWNVDSLSLKKQVIYISPTKSWMDSLVVDTVSLAGSSALYLAADSDLVDPELGKELKPGTVISTADTNQFSIVALDSYNRIVGVWLVTWKLPKEATQGNSSSSEKVSSSSVAKVASSSSNAKSSSSSVKEPDPVEESSSSSEAESSSSEVVSSSSVVKLSELSVEDGTIEVNESKVYVEVPYGTDLTAIQLSPLDTTYNLIRPVEMEFEDEQGNVATYSVVAGVQLPGSDFSERNDFWATTSDAMGVVGSGKYKPLLIEWSITMSSEENASWSESSLTLSSKVVSGKASGVAVAVDDGYKLAGGFYFAGSFSGTDCASIYQALNSEASPDPADFSQYMTYGKPFTARPSAFKVQYMYSHQENTSETYPQKMLIYVVLVSTDNKVVASGIITETSSVEEWKTQTVKLDYESDNGLLAAGYAGFSDLTEVGTKEDEVASIRVMFASSAYAYVADGGTENASNSYRGADGVTLVLDDFKLIY